MRLAYLTFLAKPNGFRLIIIGAHDSAIRMAFPLFFLVFPSIFIGFIAKDLFIGFGSNF
jgi:NADH-ubiquinone oxidoreductase chain 5